MTKNLRLATDLVIPPDAVTQTFLVVGKRGSGKSNTAARIVEQLHHARIPFVVLDPVDNWWGLKASRDGAGPGLEGVYVFGGKRADLPLEAGGGALLAEVLCEHRMPMVLSVKHLSGRERSAFMVAFAKTLFQKWAGGPLHLVLEEAHEFAPQSVQNAREGEQEMLGAFKRLWKLGRSSGIGGTAVTQRPASLSKDITTQSEILVAHRTIGPQDVKAIGEWIKYHGEQQGILADISSLPSGEAFVWAPEFPEGKPIGLRRVKVLLRDTYDSASTPKVGEHRVEPKELAPVDIERLKTKMAATIEKAKAEDPKALRTEIASLKKQLAAAPSAKGAAPATGYSGPEVQKMVERETGKILRDANAQLERARKEDAKNRQALVALGRKISGAAGNLASLAQDLEVLVEVKMEATRTEPTTQLVRLQAESASKPSTPARPPLSRVDVRDRAKMTRTTEGVAPGQQKLIDAAARLLAVNVEKPSRAQVAALAPMSPTSSATERYFAANINAGYFEIAEAGRIQLTAQGRAIAARVETAPTIEEYHAQWRRILSDGADGKLFDAAVGSLGPEDTITRSDLAKVANVSDTSSATERGFAWLIGLDLLQVAGKGTVKPGATMYPEGL